MVKLASTLSSDEHNRAKRFHFERDRTRFIAGRGLLRTILASYLAIDPLQICFSYSPRGKPGIAAPVFTRPLYFNLAHSDGLALIAVTYSSPVGIDIEQIRVLSDLNNIAERFYSRREIAALQVLPAAERSETFFTFWTRKEAWLKALGEGISDSLNHMEVLLDEEERTATIRLQQGSRLDTDWSLYDLAPAEGFKAALAASGQNLQLFCAEWHDAIIRRKPA